MHKASFHSVGDSYRDFTVKRVTPLQELQCELLELEHGPTGAQVMHIANDDPENLFCLSFKTLPDSSNGVAHILEHTVLCGSEKFPVKDPFFAMTRRSLNTFMNALTGSDFTCYPAASQVEKDFYNLLDVYLDSVFHPNLREMSFFQEGHRFEFNKAGKLEYRGIVFNEMKGAMSTPDSRMHEALYGALFPDLTYGVNSGGDPKHIPDLTYKQLVEFHQKFYHPSRCLFYFYGSFPLERHLDFIAERVLDKGEKLPAIPPLPSQPRYIVPIEVRAEYPIPEGEEIDERTQMSFGWLTCSIRDQETLLALAILDSILMDTDASLLKRALLDSGLCKQASAGLNDSISEAPFVLGLKGCRAEDADKIVELIRETLTKIADEGIDPVLIENAIHQQEFERCEITGDGYPYGLVLFMRAGLLKQHGGRGEDALKIHTLFDRLRKKLESEPNYLVNLLRKQIIDNPHFVKVILQPDPDLAATEEKEERERLDKIQAGLTKQKDQEIRDWTKILDKYQKEIQDYDKEVLPKVTLEDVPKESRIYPLSSKERGSLIVHHHDTFTNDIVYADLIYDLADLKPEELSDVSLMTTLMGQLGCGGRNFVENLRYIQAHTGGVGAGLSLHPQAQEEGVYRPALVLHGKSLQRKADRMFPLLCDFVRGADYTDRERVKEVIVKHHTALESRLVSSSLKYAMNLATAGYDKGAKITSAWSGIDYFWRVKEITQNLDKNLDVLIERFQALHERLMGLNRANLVITCRETWFKELEQNQFYGLQELGTKAYSPWDCDVELDRFGSHARDIGAPVAFTAKAFKTVPYVHPDSSRLGIASQLFDHLVLHPRIREQGGAYGGGAVNHSLSGHFVFYAYRDPNITTTFEAFDEAVERMIAGKFDVSELEEAKLEIIQGLDSPVAPGSRGHLSYNWQREGKSPKVRQEFRERVLSATKEQVIEAIQTHIQPKMKDAVAVVFAGSDQLKRENLALEEKGRAPLLIEKI